ncbi:hypothetical protein, partial [Phormidesmis priestleyi]
QQGYALLTGETGHCQLSRCDRHTHLVCADDELQATSPCACGIDEVSGIFCQIAGMPEVAVTIQRTVANFVVQQCFESSSGIRGKGFSLQ